MEVSPEVGEKRGAEAEVDGAADAKVARTEIPEPPKELEEDAAKDQRSVETGTVTFDARDATLNVIPTLGGRMLVPLTEGGMQYLIAGARANQGLSAGRYMYEVRIVEGLNPAETPSRTARTPQPRQLVRVGFSTQGASLFLGESTDSFCFDNEGSFSADKKKTTVSQRFSRDHTVAVLLNLDAGSPNANTVSLFKDGVRVSQPQPIPECLRGKVLFPHVNFRNVSLQVHFGPSPLVPLPFKCRMVTGAAKADIKVLPLPAPKDGKCEVILPVGIPDEGTFDWLDDFLEKNPQYTELSDRKILDWAAKSGLWRHQASSWKNSNDKPDMNFQIPMMDDLSIRRLLNAVVASQPRDYVVMEVKSNLLQSERAETLLRFNGPEYKKVAMVVMGEPDAGLRGRVHEAMLKEKQEKAEQEWKVRKMELDRQRAFAAQQKKIEEVRKQMEAQRQADLDAANKAAEGGEPAGEVKAETAETKEEGDGEKKTDAEKKEGDEAKTEDVEAKTEEGAEKKDDEMKGEPKEEAKEEAKEEEEEVKDEPMPEVVLTEEEKKQMFFKKQITDLTPFSMSTSFTNFSCPDASEGFDDIRYDWHSEEASKDYMRKWLLRMKVEMKVEDLQPSQWFSTKWAEWQRVLQEWHGKQNEFRDPAKMAALEAAKEAARKLVEDLSPKPEALMDAAPNPEGDAPPGDETKPKEGQSAPDGDNAAADAKKAEDLAPAKLAEPAFDLFAVEDVCSINEHGEPLFSKFTFEDWALLSLRFELHLLAHAYKRDVGDPERVGIHEMNLSFYYNKYFRKSISVAYYGVKNNLELLGMVKDTVVTSPATCALEPQMGDDMESFDIFVKLTEESRRARQRRIDAGDETAVLRFQKPAVAPPPRPQGYGKGGKDFGQAPKGFGGKDSVGQQGPNKGFGGSPGKGGFGPSGGGYHSYGGAAQQPGKGGAGFFGQQGPAGGKGFGSQPQTFGAAKGAKSYGQTGPYGGFGKGYGK